MIRELYVEQGLSLHQISRRLAIHRDVVRLRLREAGVQLRSKDEAVELGDVIRGTYLPPECAEGPCTMQPRGYNDDHPALCEYHAKRALGLLGPVPTKTEPRRSA